MDWLAKVARARERAGVFARAGQKVSVAFRDGRSVEIIANEPLSVWEVLRRAGKEARSEVTPAP